MALSEEEIVKIQNSKRGKCLIYAGNNHIETKVVSSLHEHQYITTDLKNKEKKYEENFDGNGKSYAK